MYIYIYILYYNKNYCHIHGILEMVCQSTPNNTETRKMKKHPYSHTSTHVNPISVYEDS